jgi:hypothetical protein
MKKKFKMILIPVSVIAIIALIIVGITLKNKSDDEKRINDMKQGFRAENLRGLWNVEGEDFTLLFYLDSQLKMHIRSSYGFDPQASKGIIDSIVDNNNLSDKGIISAFDSPNSGVGISLYLRGESDNSYNVLLNLCDLNQDAKSLFTKEVKITKTTMSFNSSSKEDLTNKIKDLLADKLKDYKGNKWTPINITIDENNTTDGLISAGEITGKALIASSSEELQVSYSLEVTTNPFQFRIILANGNFIIHNYKAE